MSARARTSPGRPPATDHGAIEAVAFRLFAERGFEATSLDDIAAAVGVGRRTLFRYYKSKNDIPWGQFDDSLVHLAHHLDQMPPEMPVHEAVQRAVIEFNRLDPAAVAPHRQRMTLILTTPALQAHSVLRYQQWRAVIARFVARRFDQEEDDLLPRTVGHVTLALALSAYEQWLADTDSSLEVLLAATLSALKSYLVSIPA